MNLGKLLVNFDFGGPLGNINEVILLAGFLLLDSYLNLSRKELSHSEVRAINDSLELATFQQYTMTCCKQALGVVASIEDADMKDSKEMKPHTTVHIPSFIPFAGSPRGFDTVATECAHKYFCKEPYLDSSKRKNFIYDEMINSIEERRIMHEALESFEDVEGTFNYGGEQLAVTANSRTEIFERYETYQEMFFSTMWNKANKVELVYTEYGLRARDGEHDPYRFINPLGHITTVSDALLEKDEIFHE